MTDEIHSCSYYCDRPECIKAQRDELVRKYVEAQEKAEPVACIDFITRPPHIVWFRMPAKAAAIDVYAAPPVEHLKTFDRTIETPRRRQAVEKLLNLGWTYHHERGWAEPAPAERVRVPDAIRFACWLVDHAETENVTEESVQQWLNDFVSAAPEASSHD